MQFFGVFPFAFLLLAPKAPQPLYLASEYMISQVNLWLIDENDITFQSKLILIIIPIFIITICSISTVDETVSVKSRLFGALLNREINDHVFCNLQVYLIQ